MSEHPTRILTEEPKLLETHAWREATPTDVAARFPKFAGDPERLLAAMAYLRLERTGKIPDGQNTRREDCQPQRRNLRGLSL